MRLTHRVRSLAATTLLAITAGCAVASAVAASADAPARPAANGRGQVLTNLPAAAATCRINFQASSLNLRIGQDLVLTWVAVGADKLSASWTSGYVPFAGAVTTTMQQPGTYSYQVTGTSNGKYCGGAGVQVAFTGTTPSETATSTPVGGGGGGGATTTAASGSTDTGGANGNGGANGTGGANSTGASNGVGDVAVDGGSANYPAQSPTGGSGVPWYQRPLYLLTIGALALIGALFLLKREPLRATFVQHQH